MTDLITTAEQMREAAARLIETHLVTQSNSGLSLEPASPALIEGMASARVQAAAIRAIPIASPADDEAMVERVAREMREITMSMAVNGDMLWQMRARAALASQGEG